MGALVVFGGVPHYPGLPNRRYGLAQNMDLPCLPQGGRLRNEFDASFRALFRNSERHVAIVRALGTRRAGIGRSEMSGLTGLSDGGTFATTPSGLGQCGFVRAHRDFTRAPSGETYQPVDPFALFWLRLVEGADDPRWWGANRSGGAARAWSGRAFELLCLWHVPQILRALGIWGVSVSARSWRSKSTGVPGAQVDLALDRADDVVNPCEMKRVGSGAEYSLDAAGAKDLMRKVEVFASETGTPKAPRTTMVAPWGLAPGRYSDVVQSVVTSEDLFAL